MGSRSIFTSLLFLIEVNQLSETFYGIKNAAPSQSYRISKSQNTYRYIELANINRDSPKINYKIYLLLHFLR